MECRLYTIRPSGFFAQELFEEASKFPMGWRLTDASLYVFSIVNSMAEREEIHDESRKLCDVKPFAALLKLVELQGDEKQLREKNLNAQISHLIGRGECKLKKLFIIIENM